MKPKMLLSAAAFLSVTAFLAGLAVSQDRDASRKHESEDTGTASESLIDVWVRYAMPGEHHKLLEKMAGRWDVTVKYRMNAEAPAVESEGACERKWILGNRFLLEEFDGGNLGLPFQGLAIYGYDSFEQRYTSVWVDTMSTAITANMGTCQDACKRINFVGQHGDPWTGTMRPSRGITRLADDNRHVLELYEPDGSGKEFKILEIIYTRKKETE